MKVFSSRIIYHVFLFLFVLFIVHSQNEYDPQISKMLQQYSIMNHCSQAQLTQWSCKLCHSLQKLQNFIYISSNLTDVAVYGGFHRGLDKIVLFFRGTIDVKNWIQDFNYEKLDYKYCKQCKIHAGFYLAFQSIAFNFGIATTNLVNNHPEKSILVAGSSLGAALATVAAIDLKLRFSRKQVLLHNFGSPRVGNQNLSMFIKARVPCFRVVHNRDIVPHLPRINDDYHHISREVFFDEEMHNYKICNQEGQDGSCSNSYYPNFSINDHITYWQKLDVKEIC